MTKAEVCQLIAEKLEPYGERIIKTISADEWWETDECGGMKAVDFFTDENASAKLLEAMPCPLISTRQHTYRGKRKSWVCSYDKAQQMQDDVGPEIHADRKTAIVLAAMKWLEIEGELE